MINVSDAIITEYLTDSVNKEIEISHWGYDVDALNYYMGDLSISNMRYSSKTFIVGEANYLNLPVNDEPTVIELVDYVHDPIISDWEYLNLSYYFDITSITSEAALVDSVQCDAVFNSSYVYSVNVPKEDLLSGVTITISIPRDATLDSILEDLTSITFRGWFVDNVSSNVTMEYTVSQISVNYAKTSRKPPRPWVPCPDTWDIHDLLNPYLINNDKLMYEDFTLTESLCSQDNLKFGLCEAAHCEFGIGENVSVNVGDEIHPVVELSDYPSDLTPSELFAINWVDTTNSGMQISTGTNFVDAEQVLHDPYTAEWGAYLDSLGLRDKYFYYQFKLKFEFDNLTGTKPTYFMIGYHGTYNGSRAWVSPNVYFNISDFENDYGTISRNALVTNNGVVFTSFDDVYIFFYKADKTRYVAGEGSADIMVYASEVQYRLGDYPRTMPAYNTDDLYVAKGTLNKYIHDNTHVSEIPLGVFNVSEVTKTYAHNLVTRKITAYDRLVDLENNAADWYTRYMFGVSLDNYTGSGFQYARQIFSTYWAYVSSIGLDTIENYELSTYHTFSDSDWICDHNNCYGYIEWEIAVGNYRYRSYAANEVTIDDPKLLYRVTYGNFAYQTDEEIMTLYNPGYVESGEDTMLRGFGTIGGVCIEEYRSGENAPYNAICVNRGDFFMLSPDTAKIKVVLPSGATNSLGYSLVEDVTIETATPRQALVNGNLRLCYYNYGNRSVFACDTNITGRDVVRSLLEVCGCFFRLDRLNGLPEFVYPTKGGLYPSNTLYPADDLYPRAGTDTILTMGKYLSVTSQNYEVTDFGRIQILKKAKSNDTVSVCEWQYEGDSSKENTYIIDDNIFYCAEEMEYDYDNMPEVSDMLEGMWGVICNLGYVPNVTEAIGAPWLECGDRVGLLTYDGGLETFIFRRTLKGIQNLRDTYESTGDEKNEAINNFGY